MVVEGPAVPGATVEEPPLDGLAEAEPPPGTDGPTVVGPAEEGPTVAGVWVVPVKEGMAVAGGVVEVKEGVVVV